MVGSTPATTTATAEDNEARNGAGCAAPHFGALAWAVDCSAFDRQLDRSCGVPQVHAQIEGGGGG